MITLAPVGCDWWNKLHDKFIIWLNLDLEYGICGWDAWQKLLDIYI